MSYSQTLDFLYSSLPMFQRLGTAAYKTDLTNTLRIAQLLSHPEQNFKSIHIAGTNGKGSVSHLLASILQEAGYKTGLFTSPHLKDFRERIKVNGKKIGKRDVVDFVENSKAILSELAPSFFEYTFAMACQYFNEEEVDIAVLETGMGGRLDSTNIVIPEVSVITNIGYDHMQFLGNTLEKIAIEKAGIIKAGVPVIIGETQEESINVFYKKAKELSCELIRADELFTIENIKKVENSVPLIEFDVYENSDLVLKDVYCPLTGQYQRKNIVTAIGVIKQLKTGGYNVENKHIIKGIRNVVKNTGIMGRWQILGNNPLIICDTAHNEAGIKFVVEQINTLKFSKLHWILGIVNDKSLDKVLALLPSYATYYFCKANIPRGLDAAILKEESKKHNLHGQTFPSVMLAYHHAINNSSREDLIFVGGSTFTVAEIV
ncbi:MAG: bifunctional folylpolyglutamate synthase/dihydrofolate synthase [Bacteroidales bacterium]|nr:bifunctional folylpolyglutamate synthase/dihydrofolate synthase [Bacteroidales bacterium]MCF8404256.1 bifunctional folylpolyglutamate synthase/dihydrofolate synthase [Bacteroidales bacterium]